MAALADTMEKKHEYIPSDVAQWRIKASDLRLTAKIGSGTFGDVYEGTWRDRPAAMKRIKIELENDHHSFDDLLRDKKWREFDVWFQLRSPHIVDLYGAALQKNEFSKTDWYITFVMEKCEASLYDMLKEVPNIGIEHRLKFAYEMALGMKYLHDHNVLHRDLKSMNILINDDIAKICDFGTARFRPEMDGDITLRATGTPSHMAPEIWKKKGASRASDVWSYGMCVYHLMSGKMPFEGMDFPGLQNFLIREDKRPLWPRDAIVPKWVKQMVNKCWKTRPELRLTFKDILGIFEEFAKPVIHPPPPTEDERKINTTLTASEGLLGDRFVASVVLSAVGDMLGFFNGKFENERNGARIHKAVAQLGGALELNPASHNLHLSSDIIFSMAVSRAMISEEASKDFELTQKGFKLIMEKLAVEYIRALKDCERSAGNTTHGAIRRLGFRSGSRLTAEKLRRHGALWFSTPYAEKSGGCGGTTRACPIGLRFPGKSNRAKLIAVAIEAGRMTHNNAIGFLGSLVAALFTAYAIEGIHPYDWGKLLINEALPMAYEYLEVSVRDFEHLRRTKDFKKYQIVWKKYLKERNIERGNPPVRFPRRYGVNERDKFYKSYSFRGKGGASGHDAVIIAYDALLGAIHFTDQNKELVTREDKTRKMWEEVLLRGVFHGGDTDSTGTIVGAWFGALYGFSGINIEQYKEMQKYKELQDLGVRLGQCV